MAQLVGADDIESTRVELSEIGRSITSSFGHNTSDSGRSSLRLSPKKHDTDIEYAQQWAAVERQSTINRMRSSIFVEEDDSNPLMHKETRVVDVTKLESLQKHMFIEKLIKHIEHDNLLLLQKIRNRINKVGVELPKVEVRYRNLSVEAKCEVVLGKPLPTLWNSLKGFGSNIMMLAGSKSREAKISIISDVSGVIKPGRMALLLGPPGCGKTTLLKALSGNLYQSLKLTGEVSYNGFKLDELVPQKTSAYISQQDVHIPEMTVRETIDFSARCQGVGSRAEIMMEVIRREKERGIVPEPDIDTYMKAISVDGQQRILQTDYILKILGLDVCADIFVGDAMRRGISGGQKKRLTTGEMTVGPIKAFFMDEITNGLDSSTAFQVVACLQQLAHITDATILASLLQPAPETFQLFDEIILMAEGKVVYHGPRECILDFFGHCGFRCPERKGVADFLQEVISKKDQAQYWHNAEVPYTYFSVDLFSRLFKESLSGKKLDEELSVPEPYDKSESTKNAISLHVYSLPKWELFRACMSREVLLMKRNAFLYVFKTCQIIITAFITMTVFLRTRLSIDVSHANYYMGALYFALVQLLIDAMPELFMTVARLQVFYKQKELYLYPAWAYSIPATILKVPLSLVVSLAWTSLTYYVIGYSPEFTRFLRQFILLFAVHFTSTSMFCFLASIFQTSVAATTAGSFAILLLLLFGGFVIARASMPGWLRWAFWVSPISYGEIGLSVNEFLAPRWQKLLFSDATIGQQTLESRGLNFDGYMYWISLGALFSFALLFNVGFTLALSFLKSPGISRSIVSREKLSQIPGTERSSSVPLTEKRPKVSSPSSNTHSNRGRMVLPFEPLTLAFQDVHYCVDTPMEMKEHGFIDGRLQLLSGITGSFRPGVLTALMGVSGAGKTTLLDVLSGRKTSGYTEGVITIGGHPKVQETFARICGYCEQTDIHSPQMTVEESVMFSAWLRLSPLIESKTKAEFVNDVLETIELDGIKDELVGVPGVSGVSTEQRKRLTIAVELVANPSIIFMDEPTTGLDARAAAIVMRAVKNVVNTGRTTVCTIHQPSIDIFEAFDELILLKTGGHMIYSGQLGHHSSAIIEYFEAISGVPKIRNNYNPATWMMDVTSASIESDIGVDFSQLYNDSSLYEANMELVRKVSTPTPGSSDLKFPTRFSQNSWGQFKSCLWKQHLSYWRSPSYNLMRTMHTTAASLLFGLLFWNQGKKIDNQQNLFNVLGSMYVAVIFLGINNCSSVLPYVSNERSIMYRERFAGMYSSWAYSLAQVTVEIPYLLIQSVIFTVITYPMIGYYGSAYKVFWYFYAMLCALLYYNYMGMLLVSLTPNYTVAAILSSAVYTLFNLFSGFLIPQPKIPRWWVWLYYLTPTSWTLNGLLTSQYGDIEKDIVVFKETKTMAAFLKDYYGFRHDRLPVIGVVLISYPLVFALLFSFFVGRLNFLRR